MDDYEVYTNGGDLLDVRCDRFDYREGRIFLFVADSLIGIVDGTIVKKQAETPQEKPVSPWWPWWY